MKINHYENGNPELRGLANRLEKQKNNGTIEPRLIEYIYLEDDFSSPMNYITMENGDLIKGILAYNTQLTSNLTRPYSVLYDSIKLSLESEFNIRNVETITILHEIESYEKRIGIGKSLVGNLKSMEDVKNILLIPRNNIAIDFFNDSNFKRTDIQLNNDKITMMYSYNDE